MVHVAPAAAARAPTPAAFPCTTASAAAASAAAESAVPAIGLTETERYFFDTQVGQGHHHVQGI